MTWDLHLPAAQIGSSIIIRSHAARRRRRGASRPHLRQHLSDLERRADAHGLRPVEHRAAENAVGGAAISSASRCSTRMETCWPVPSGTARHSPRRPRRVDGRHWRRLHARRGQRSRPCASRLIELLVERERAAGALLAGLFSEIGAGVLRAAWFPTVPLDEVTITVTLKGGSPAMLVRSGVERDLPTSRRCTRRERPVSVLRSAAIRR